jgi:hypothetical protein
MVRGTSRRFAHVRRGRGRPQLFLMVGAPFRRALERGPFSPPLEVGGLLELSLYFFDHHILDLDALDRQEREGPWAAS